MKPYLCPKIPQVYSPRFFLPLPIETKCFSIYEAWDSASESVKHNCKTTENMKSKGKIKKLKGRIQETIFQKNQLLLFIYIYGAQNTTI